MTKPTIDALAKVGDLPLGFTAKPGSTMDFKTGDWRSVRPILDREKCIHCAFCYYYCPDGVYKDMYDGKDDATKYFQADYDYCKGCGICAQECPKKAITMTLEEV